MFHSLTISVVHWKTISKGHRLAKQNFVLLVLQFLCCSGFLCAQDIICLDNFLDSENTDLAEKQRIFLLMKGICLGVISLIRQSKNFLLLLVLKSSKKHFPSLINLIEMFCFECASKIHAFTGTWSIQV